MRKARFWPKINFNPIKTFPNWRRRLDVMRTFPWLDYIKNPEEFIKDIQSLLTFAQSSRLAAF